MPMTINSPAVIAAANGFCGEAIDRMPKESRVAYYGMALAALQAAGVGELVEALDRIHTTAVGDAACTHDSETFAAIKASRPLVAKFTGG